jgi:glycosyltransferase involved in cell wall biosynthesis
MLAAEANPKVPLVLSVWGNDFSLHARSTPWMGWLTRRAVTRANGLHADCHRDIRLALEWGYSEKLPTLVAPGSGGLDRSIFKEGQVEPDQLRPEIRSRLHGISSETPVVINPRGFRSYVRNEVFFESIPLILNQYPDTTFLAPSMAGEQPAQAWINELDIEDSVILLPRLNPLEMAQLYRYSQVMVSPSVHDGTPNTFLEAIACGCFPVVGNLESLGEWITDGVNGLLIDPNNPEALAGAVIRGLREKQLRFQAAEHNQTIIDERAAKESVAESLDRFYADVASLSTPFPKDEYS